MQHNAKTNHAFQRMLMTSQMKEELANATADSLTQVMRSLTNSTANQLQALSNKEAAEKAVLDYYNTEIEKVSDTEFIRLMKQLSVSK